MNIQTIPDGNTHFDKVELKSTIAGIRPTPHCKEHGAMLKVSVIEGGGGYWRCCTVDGVICRAGCIEVRVKDYSQEPVFIKKAEEATAFLKEHGFPNRFKAHLKTI